MTRAVDHGATYLGHVLAGRDPGDIEDWVGHWHAGGSDLELYEFLGMTLEEYGILLRLPNALPEIAALRRRPDAARLAALEERAQSAWTGVAGAILRDVGRLD